MDQQRLFLVRCFAACLLASVALLATLTLPATAPRALAEEAGSTIDITSTLSVDNGSFTDSGAILPGVQDGVAVWGDCDNDGRSDVLIAGQLSTTVRIAQVYRQVADTFVQAAAFTGVVQSAAAWGDYDNDGWLDLVLTGESINGPISVLWRNTGNCIFSVVATNLVGVQRGSVAWGDYNADGQSDLLLAGYDGAQPVTKLYRNNHGSFIDSGLALPGIQNGTAAWGDYDSDGLVDLLLTGSTGGGTPLTNLYRNNGSGGLTLMPSGLPALGGSKADWGDYDNDGDLDLILEGTTNLGLGEAGIYRNDNGSFSKNPDANSLKGGFWSGVGWGDYDTDGYRDALSVDGSIAKAYRNEITGSFAAGIDVGPALQGGTVMWGNYDSDRNLDVLMTGWTVQGPIALIYKYWLYTPNTRPSVPTSLNSIVNGAAVTLRWSMPITDDHTPLSGLSYNVRVGTTPGGVDLVAPLALTATGTRLVPAAGNAYAAREITLRDLPRGRPLYWSVQAIDASYVGSNFADDGVFQIPYQVFLPTTLRDAVTYYNSAWETEPNNTYLQANGPLPSGRIIQGVHNDERDYFSVFLPVTGTLAITMTTPSGGTQLQLFYQIADVAHRLAVDVVPPYQITYGDAQPGWYYIYVYTNPAFVGTQTYSLTVTYP